MVYFSFYFNLEIVRVFCRTLYIGSYMSCLKMFSHILQVFVCNVWWCSVSKFYHKK